MNELLTEKEAAALLKCSERWLQDRRRADEVPYLTIPPKLIRYDREQLLEWARSYGNNVTCNVDGVDDNEEPKTDHPETKTTN